MMSNGANTLFSMLNICSGLIRALMRNASPRFRNRNGTQFAFLFVLLLL